MNRQEVMEKLLEARKRHQTTVSPKEQEEQFRMEWEAKNPELAGKQDTTPEPEPEPDPTQRWHRNGGPAVLLEVANLLDAKFHLPDLIVEAWKSNPHLFGLDRYETLYPDARRVYILLVGPRGLIARGYFRKVGNMLEVVRAKKS